jgi:hypothetical protein
MPGFSHVALKIALEIFAVVGTAAATFRCRNSRSRWIGHRLSCFRAARPGPRVPAAGYTCDRFVSLRSFRSLSCLVQTGGCCLFRFLDETLAQTLAALREGLRLPTQKFTLSLSPFLRTSDADHLVAELECVLRHFFGERHRMLLHGGCLLNKPIGHLAHDSKHALNGDLALIEVLFRYFRHPVCADARRCIAR